MVFKSNCFSISIHALLAESDIPGPAGQHGFRISIHALLAESDGFEGCQQLIGDISIHALLAESDGGKRQDLSLDSHFYPRSPCGERRGWTLNINGPLKFLSTLSLRRATAPQPPQGKSTIFLSTLSLRRATRLCTILYSCPGISIHALLAESDGKPKALKSRLCVFLSTLSLRRATGT